MALSWEQYTVDHPCSLAYLALMYSITPGDKTMSLGYGIFFEESQIERLFGPDGQGATMADEARAAAALADHEEHDRRISEDTAYAAMMQRSRLLDILSCVYRSAQDPGVRDDAFAAFVCLAGEAAADFALERLNNSLKRWERGNPEVLRSALASGRGITSLASMIGGGEVRGITHVPTLDARVPAAAAAYAVALTRMA